VRTASRRLARVPSGPQLLRNEVRKVGLEKRRDLLHDLSAPEQERQASLTMTERAFNSNTSDEVALLDAAFKGTLPTVKRMLAKGLDPNTPDMREDPWNVTPLMHAAANGHVEVMRELLRVKAKVGLTDKSFPGEGGGETALHYAAGNGQIGAAGLLLEAGADLDKVSRLGRTPLTVAVLEGRADMVQYLLENKASPNCAGKFSGETPLHEAARLGLIELVGLLVKHGADVNAQDSGGQTPFMTAAFSPNLETAFFLARHGANLEAAKLDGITCLMRSVMSEDAKLVSEVLKCGVNVNALDNEGKSALDFAIRDELPEIQALLRKSGAKTGAELRPRKKAARARQR